MEEAIEEVQAVKYTIKKFLELLRGIFDADVCYLYLMNKEMDVYEKKGYLKERLADIKSAYLSEDKEYPEELLCYDTLFSQSEDVSSKDIVMKKIDDNGIMKSIDILKYIDVSKKENVTGWVFDYSNRPKKYVIFKEYAKEKQILKEGLTAYIARAGEKIVCKTHQEIVKYESSAFLNSKSGITDCCHMMIGFPLTDRDGHTIGVLKIENYCKGVYNYDAEIEEASEYIRLLIRLIKSSESSFKTNSYKKLFRGMNLLDNLKKIYPSGEINEYIHQQTLHLFLVLERNEYIGYEEIMKRITAYVNDISEHLELKGEMTMSFNKYLEKFRKHEELLLSGLNDYRDHFMHQFHVFVSGYIIINEFGIENFRLGIQENMHHVFKGKDLDVSETSVFRIWFLAAFYHDYAYILEKIDTELSEFFKDLLGYEFSVKFNWEQLLTKDSNFPIHLSNLTKFFSSSKGTNPDALLRNYLNSIIVNHDHGVLSALLLINNSKGTQEIINECLYAALAISMHNKTVYEGLTEGDTEKISFESFPIAFLLVFCDTAQAFGRLEKKDKVESSRYPVMFDGLDINKDEKVIYKLRYISNKPDEIPTGEMIESWAKKINHVFKSDKYSFEIQYYKRAEERIRAISF